MDGKATGRSGSIAAIAVAALCIAVVFAPISSPTYGIRVLHDFSHAPIFGCVAILALMLIRAHMSSLNGRVVQQYLLAFAAAVGLGAITELAQIPVGRDASWADLRSDVFGAASFLLLLTALDRRWARGVWTGVRLATGIGLLLIHSWPLIAVAHGYVIRSKQFPILVDGAIPLDMQFINPQSATLRIAPLPHGLQRKSDERALHVVYKPGRWQGLDFYDPVPDWRGRSTFVIELANADDLPLQVSLRIEDRQHNNEMDDRFNRRLSIPAASRTVVRIPLSEIEVAPKLRKLDMAHIARILLFQPEASTVSGVYVVRISLE